MGGKQKASVKKQWAKKPEKAISLEVKETKHREKMQSEEV